MASDMGPAALLALLLNQRRPARSGGHPPLLPLLFAAFRLRRNQVSSRATCRISSTDTAGESTAARIRSNASRLNTRERRRCQAEFLGHFLKLERMRLAEPPERA
jgi:hypothetical protein